MDADGQGKEQPRVEVGKGRKLKGKGKAKDSDVAWSEKTQQKEERLRRKEKKVRKREWLKTQVTGDVMNQTSGDSRVKRRRETVDEGGGEGERNGDNGRREIDEEWEELRREDRMAKRAKVQKGAEEHGERIQMADAQFADL